MPLAIRKIVASLGTSPYVELKILCLKYGAALYLAKAPTIGNVNSDGSGDSLGGTSPQNVGLWLDQVGTRHVLQTSSPAKPQRKMVPAKLGSELVINGDFSAGTSGWSAFESATLSVSEGVATLTKTAGSYGSIRQIIPTVAGKKYSVTAEITNPNGVSAYFNAVAGNTLFGVFSGNQTYIFTAQAASSGLEIGFYNTAPVATVGQSLTIDNVSVREVLEEQPAIVFDPTDDALNTTVTASPTGVLYKYVTNKTRVDAAATGGSVTISAIGVTDSTKRNFVAAVYSPTAFSPDDLIKLDGLIYAQSGLS